MRPSHDGGVTSEFRLRREHRRAYLSISTSVRSSATQLCCDWSMESSVWPQPLGHSLLRKLHSDRWASKPRLSTCTGQPEREKSQGCKGLAWSHHVISVQDRLLKHLHKDEIYLQARIFHKNHLCVQSGDNLLTPPKMYFVNTLCILSRVIKSTV